MCLIFGVCVCCCPCDTEEYYCAPDGSLWTSLGSKVSKPFCAQVPKIETSASTYVHTNTMIRNEEPKPVPIIPSATLVTDQSEFTTATVDPTKFEMTTNMETPSAPPLEPEYYISPPPPEPEYCVKFTR